MPATDQHLEAERDIRTRGRIVVGVDGSPCSLAALQWAAREARSDGADLVAVYAWHLPYVGLPGLSPPYDKDGFVAAARTLVEAAIDQVPEAAGARVQVVEGHAGAALVEASRDASLLVVGSHGHGVVPGTLLGSVSNRVAMHAACPVVIVRLEH